MAALNTVPAAAAHVAGTSRPGPKSMAFDLITATVRDVNAELHHPTAANYEVRNPQGAHALAVGITSDIAIDIRGHVGYYCAGMNDGGRVTVHGTAGTGVAENMMSGYVHITGNVSQSAGASAHGGLLVIEGSASMRCGISLKGGDIVVGGSVGPMSAFMAQAGRIVVCGDAGDGLGDSLYEARIYVKGRAGTLGADCVAKEMRPAHVAELRELLDTAGLGAVHDPAEFTRYGSARTLYHFAAHNSGAY